MALWTPTRCQAHVGETVIPVFQLKNPKSGTPEARRYGKDQGTNSMWSPS